MRRAVEPCGLVVDSMVDARSARQSIDGRQLFVAEPPMKQCEAGAVGRVQASDGRSFASMPHHMLHDLRVSRRSDGISESIAIRLNERRSEGASMSDCVCERGAALLCTHKAILQGDWKCHCRTSFSHFVRASPRGKSARPARSSAAAGDDAAETRRRCAAAAAA